MTYEVFLDKINIDNSKSLESRILNKLEVNMKKIKIIILSMLLIFPMSVYALTGSVSIVCNPTSVKPGENVDCLIKGNSDELVGSIEASIANLNEMVSVESFDIKSPFTGDGITDNKIQISNTDGVKDDFDIGTIKLKVSDTASNGEINLGLVSIKFYGMDDTEGTTINNASSSITVKNEEVSKGLKSLSVEGYNISPIFNSTITSYIVTIKENSFKINAVAANDSDEIKIYNVEDESTLLDANNIKFNPKDGAMVIAIKVGDMVYRLAVTRTISADYDNTIKSITIGGKTIDLIEGKYDGYEVTLDDVKEYDIKVILNDEENFYVADAIDGVIKWQDVGDISIIIYPKDSSSGIESLKYWIRVKKSDTGAPSSDSSKPSSNTGGITNPQTGNISIFVITLILIGSLILSLNLYKKNMNYYD